MRVVHWFPNFSAGGGVANSVLALANAQSAEGADVTVVTLPHTNSIYGELKPDASLGMTTWDGRSLGRGHMRIHHLGRSRIERLRTLRPDVVHIHAEFNPNNWWAPRVWSCPLVLTPHGAFHTAVLRRGRSRKAAFVAVARRALYSKIGAFHALSPSEAQDITRVIPPARTYVVSQGPSPGVAAFVAQHDGYVSRSAENRTGPVRFLYLGRIDVEPKGLDILVKGFATALRDSLDPASATLTMVGPDTGGGADRLRVLASRLAVEHAVQIRAPVPQSKVPSVLEECDVYVQLSRNEGSPLSLNDALFMGKPAIISDSIGTASDPAVSSLQHVLVVRATPESAAVALAHAVAAIDQLGESARSAQADVRALLSWPSAAAKHLGLYKALAQSSRVA